VCDVPTTCIIIDSASLHETFDRMLFGFADGVAMLTYKTVPSRKNEDSVQLWTRTKNFNTNHPKIRYWPWTTSFQVTGQNYFSIYFGIILPICTHCQPLNWSQVCIHWNLCKKDSGLLKRGFVGKCACFWECIMKTCNGRSAEDNKNLLASDYISPPSHRKCVPKKWKYLSWNVDKILL
jgi:hypothetical protein